VAVNLVLCTDWVDGGVQNVFAPAWLAHAVTPTAPVIIETQVGPRQWVGESVLEASPTASVAVGGCGGRLRLTHPSSAWQWVGVMVLEGFTHRQWAALRRPKCPSIPRSSQWYSPHHPPVWAFATLRVPMTLD
jgi:hypothetical protein